MDNFDRGGYRPSGAELRRLKQIEVAHAPDGSVEIIDHSPVKWKPTEQQVSFLENLLDVSGNQLSIYKAAAAVGASTWDVKRWCRREPQFLALFKARVTEYMEVAQLDADLTVIGASEGSVHPTRDQKWGIKQMTKIRDFLHRSEIRFLQINQQFNMGTQVDQDDEALLKVINAGQEGAAKTIKDVIGH